MDANALAVGDLNGDGLPDIVLLGDNGSLYFLPQKPDHTFGEPQKIPYSGSPKAVQIADVNGDGRKDLLLVDWDSPTPFRFRLQNAAGQLGPEIYFKTPPIRAYCADNLEGNSNLFVVTICAKFRPRGSFGSSRASRRNFCPAPFARGSFKSCRCAKTDAAQRGLLWADVNGDGRPDLLVAEPESGQLSVYLQQPDGSLAPPKTFPTLAGVSQIGGGGLERRRPSGNFPVEPERKRRRRDGVRQERAAAVSHAAAARRQAAGDGGRRAEARRQADARVIVDKDGQRSLVTRTADGKMRTQKLSDSFKANPTTMAIQDVNQDGLADLVVLIPYEKIKVLLQKPGGDFDEEDVDPPGGAIEQPWLASADVDGDGKTGIAAAAE